MSKSEEEIVLQNRVIRIRDILLERLPRRYKALFDEELTSERLLAAVTQKLEKHKSEVIGEALSHISLEDSALALKELSSKPEPPKEVIVSFSRSKKR